MLAYDDDDELFMWKFFEKFYEINIHLPPVNLNLFNVCQQYAVFKLPQ